jgi:hypothetical protein
MRAVTMTVVLVALALPALGQPAATTADLAFLAGCWKFEAKGRIVEEHWMAPAGGSLIGVSRTVVNGKLTEFEFLQIRDRAEGLTYIAKPSNQPEAKFVVSAKSADEVVFENPEHDFPQRIRYRLTGNTLNARIEGTMNGKTRGIDFPYARVMCAP